MINAILADPQVDQLAVLLASLPGEGALRTARAIREAIARHNKPIMLSWSPRRKRAEAASRLLDDGHVPIYKSPVRVAEAAAWLAGFSAARSAPRLPRRRRSRASRCPRGVGALDEARSKALLAQIGIPVAREIVLPADTDKPAALDLQFPVAVKAAVARYRAQKRGRRRACLA